MEVLEGRRLLAGDLFASTSALTDSPLSAESQSGPVVTTDKLDYSMGETANITGTGFEIGETVQFQVLHTDSMVTTDGLVARIDFDIYVIPYKGEDDWVEPVLHEIYDCLNDDNLPKSSPDCDYCAYLAAVGKHVNDT